MREHRYVLTSGCCFGAPPQEDDGGPFEEKMTRLVARLRGQRAEGTRLHLDKAIEDNLERLG